MKEDDWKTKLNELHFWEPRVGESENGLRTGLQSGTATGDWGLGTVDWGMLLQIHNYMRLMSLLKLQQHVARLHSRERTSKRPTESEQRSSHNSDSHKPAMLTTARKGHKWLHRHTGTQLLTYKWRLSQVISLDICPIITTDSGSFQLSNVFEVPPPCSYGNSNNILVMPPVRYIWLCLVKQITTTNKLHRNQSERRPTKGTATDTDTDTDIDP